MDKQQVKDGQQSKDFQGDMTGTHMSPMSLGTGTPKQKAGGPQSKNILVGEQGDILARYRIPIENKNVDYDLQLPEDSDSSNFSSDENGEKKDEEEKEEHKD